ncbi:metal-dependent phosphohydrolase [Synechococcales cyanobacterium C]|uniref:Metal-dependent phosphohydrolase n=1 Tax=Petrachloros mirabilis ULC683 TaxID=2781853 RepID=A0A8K1ZVG9_9CYAN|nr:DICT sensory domain-containing protein [Petrachloros mirabilis]NCJ05849.1 metal-dependent phosphohydrolase [Petrachloros mirabilis ULC683]
MLNGSILQKLATAHRQPSSTSALSLGVYYKNTLVSLCHALEDCILTCESQPLVLTAFQRGKWYLQEADRYGELAQQGGQIVILAAPDAGFAEHPTSQHSNVSLVSLADEDPVAQEWHLVIWSPTYAAMVLCQELSDQDYGVDGRPQCDRERKFYGFWTFESTLVQEVVTLLVDHIHGYQPNLAQALKTQAESIATVRQTTVSPPLEPVVSRVVDYLQTNHEDLSGTDGQGILGHNLVSNEVQAFLRMAQILDLADAENPNSAAEVAALGEMLGQLLELPAWQLKRLRLAGLLHRLGGLSGSPRPFMPTRPSPTEAPAYPFSCALVPGAQALRTMSRLRAVAQIINHQLEWWNGSGYPAGLAADDIPLESRILGLIVYVQSEVRSLQPPEDSRDLEVWQQQLQACLQQCQQTAGERWDPKLVEMLTLVVTGLLQGITLPMLSPKLSNSLWLLDSVADSESTQALLNRPAPIS